MMLSKSLAGPEKIAPSSNFLRQDMMGSASCTMAGYNRRSQVGAKGGWRLLELPWSRKGHQPLLVPAGGAVLEGEPL